MIKFSEKTMLKLILLALALFVVVNCEDSIEISDEDLDALPDYKAIVKEMTQAEKDRMMQWLKRISKNTQESARANAEFGERDLQVLRRLVAKKVPGYETFLDENGEPTEVGRLRLYKELGYRRVSK